MTIKPLFKWAGGKTQLLPTLLSYYDKIQPDIFVECFVGGGAFFLSLLDSKFNLFNSRKIPSTLVINDANQELINVYRMVQTNPHRLIEELTYLEKRYNNSFQKESFYLLRRNYYNAKPSPSLFLFLNKTCFNGLYRLNKEGDFNVGWNKAKEISFDTDNILAVSKALQGVTILSKSFDELPIIKGAFYYLDPPYKPLSKTSSFNRYLGSFSDDDQLRIKEFCDSIHRTGGYFLQSNSAHPFFDDLYQGYSIDTVSANRAINSKGNQRGAVNEYLIHNT